MSKTDVDVGEKNGTLKNTSYGSAKSNSLRQDENAVFELQLQHAS